MLSHQELIEFVNGNTIESGPAESFYYFFARKAYVARETYFVEMAHATSEEGVRGWIQLFYNAKGFVDAMVCDDAPETVVSSRTDYLPLDWAYEVFHVMSVKAALKTNYCIHMEFGETSKYVYILDENTPCILKTDGCTYIMRDDGKALELDTFAECLFSVNGITICICNDWGDIIEGSLESTRVSDDEKHFADKEWSQNLDERQGIFSRLFKRKEENKFDEMCDFIYKTLTELYEQMISGDIVDDYASDNVNEEETLHIDENTDVDYVQNMSNIIREIRQLNEVIPDHDMISQKLYILEKVVTDSYDNGHVDIPSKNISLYIPQCIELTRQYIDMPFSDKDKNSSMVAEMIENATIAIKSENESEVMWKQMNFEAEVKAMTSILGASKSIDEQLSPSKVTVSVLEIIKDSGFEITGYDHNTVVCIIPGHENVVVYVNMKGKPSAKISVNERLLDKTDMCKPEYTEYIRKTQRLMKEVNSCNE